MPIRSSRTCAALALALSLSCSAENDVTRAPVVTAAPTSTAPPVPPPLPSGRLPGTAKPLRYQVSLAIDPEKDRFLGDVSIQVEVPATTQGIVLHGRDLTILRAEVASNGESIPANATFRKAAGSKESADELVLVFSKPIPAGAAEIRVAYSADLSDKLSGLYRVKENGVWYAFTQFEPTDARRMMPCFDEPSYKVPFELKVTTPKGNIVVANSDEVDRSPSEDGRTVTFRFAPTPPLPTYLFALAVGPLEIKEGTSDPVKIRLVTTKGKSQLGDQALEAAAAHVKLLAEYFDRPYPYQKLDLLAVPEFGFGAMENAGLISFREELILVDPKSAAAEPRRQMATNLAHEIAHHWMGNLVTMTWWDDLWLNEGFATWMEAKIVDEWRPGENARIESLDAKDEAMREDALASARAVRQPVNTTSEAEEAFDNLTYDKGAAVLGMLEAWLGEATFRQAMRAYVKTHEHGSATAADLFQALAKAANKDVWPVASTFLDQPGVPLVRGELLCNNGEARVKLSEERYRPRPAAASDRGQGAWKIPVCVDYEGRKGDAACGVLESQGLELPLGKGCPKWIYPNSDERGYYRFALPPAQLLALASAGRAVQHTERVGLVDDAWALVQEGDLGSDQLLDLLWAMRREKNRVVVKEMVDTLGYVSRSLVDDASRAAFKGFASSILLPMAKDLGWDAKKSDGDEQKLDRKIVLGALASLAEDPWLASEAEKRTRAFLKDPASVDGDIAKVALLVAARRGNEQRWTDLVDATKRAKTPMERVLAVEALGSFSDPALLKRSLDLMLEGGIKIQDSFYIFDAAMAWPDQRARVLGWVKDHFAELKAKLPDFALTRLATALSGVCDADVEREYAGFFKDALKGVEGADRVVSQAVEAADICVELKGREGARARKRLGVKTKP